MERYIMLMDEAILKIFSFSFCSLTMMCLCVLFFDVFLLRISRVFRICEFSFITMETFWSLFLLILLCPILSFFPSICMYVEHSHHFSNDLFCIFLSFSFMYLQIFYWSVFNFFKSVFFLSLQVWVLFCTTLSSSSVIHSSAVFNLW